MLQADCPECGAQISFEHAASAATVCPSCRSVVLRGAADAPVVAGRVSSIARDLSPLQVGARGQAEGRAFEIVGGLRRAHRTARWNEWALRFSDGGAGWIGEGNGQWRVFTIDAPITGLQIRQLRAGEAVELGGAEWRVTERGAARVIAADGELPFAPALETPAAFADLASADGRRVATLEEDDQGGLRMWTGRFYSLEALKLQGLRAFAGWSSPAALSQAGPEISGTRGLRCPQCSGALSLRNPGSLLRFSCPYCASIMDIGELDGEVAATLVASYRERSWQPTLKLGAKGKLRGEDWQIIGAQRRFVEVDGVRYYWTEYALFNPYVGEAWLVEDGRGHWSLVRRLSAVPAGGAARTQLPVRHAGESFRHFQSGTAETSAVLGEFGWLINVGDQAQTHDYVAPPQMLSLEVEGEERVWSLGEYLPVAEVQAAFGQSLAEPLLQARGVGPHQPNPLDGKAKLAATLGLAGVLWAGAFCLMVLTALFADDELLLQTEIQSQSGLSDVFLTESFEVPDRVRRDLEVRVRTSLGREQAQINVALLNQRTGEAVYPLSTEVDNNVSGRVGRPDPGPYVARVEVARPSEVGGAGVVTLEVRRDPPWFIPMIPLFFFPGLLPLAFLGRRGAFESQRWAESDHAG